MRKIYILGATLFSCLLSLQAQTSYTWTSSGSNSFTTSTNWTPNGLPGPIDDVIFNGSSVVNCNIDDNIDVNSLSITSAYTGTVDGLAVNITIESSFNQTGGTFVSSTANIDMLGPLFSVTGGTFLHNGGDVTFYPTTVSTFSIVGAITFNNLNVSTSAGSTSTERFINFGNCTTANLMLMAATVRVSYAGNVAVTSNLTIQGTNTGNPSANTGIISFTGAGPITIVGAGAAARNKLPSIVMNTSGNISMSNHINLQGSWTGTQGTLIGGTSTVNMYGASTSILGTAAAFDNLTIQTGASVTMPANEVLIGRALTRTGTLNFQTGTILGLNGPTGVTQTIAGSAFTVSGIHAYSNGTRNVTISTPVRILDFLQVDGGVTFASGGNITLNSTNALTARVGPLGSGASITGNVTVETVIPGGATGWANLGVPGVTGQTVANWDTYTSSGGANGVPMTCDGCNYGVSSLGSDFYSIQGWNESLDDYDTTVTASTPLTPGQGFWVYVGSGASSSTDLKLVNSGPLVQGNPGIMTTASGSGAGIGEYYNLVANPFASPISWGSVVANNGFFFPDAIYAWSADLGPTSYVGGTADNGIFGINDIIPAGQAFYIINPGTPNVLSFNEIDKVTVSGTYPIVKPATPTNTVGQTFRLRLQGAADKSETVIRIHGNATPLFDKRLDARKMFVSPGYVGYPGSYAKYTSLSTKDGDGGDYSIQSLPPLQESVTIPLLAMVSASGTYTLHAYDFKEFNSCVAVVDKVTKTYHDLRQGDYVFTISDTTSAPRFDLVLCRDEAVNPTGVTQLSHTSNSIFINQDAQGAYVKTAFAQSTKATISVYNVIGQKLMDDIQVDGTATSTYLNLQEQHNQVVLIRVVTANETSTKRIVVH